MMKADSSVPPMAVWRQRLIIDGRGRKIIAEDFRAVEVNHHTVIAQHMGSKR